MKIIIGISIAVLMLATVLIIKKVSMGERTLPIIASFPEKDIKNIFGEDAFHKILNKPFPYLKVSSGNGEIAGYLFASRDLDIINHGYKTEVKLFVATDSRHTIKKVVLHDIKETPKHVAKIIKNGMIEKWQGRDVSDIPPDTVTGATKTSSAINRSVTETLKKINSL